MSIILTYKRLTSFFNNSIPEKISSLLSVRFPEGIKSIYLDDNELTRIDNIILPDGIKWLSLDKNCLESAISEFPESLQVLYLSNNRLANVPLLPPRLTRLFLHNNLLTDVNDVCWPDSLTMLYLDNNRISDISHITFPEGIKWLKLNGNLLDFFNDVYISPATSLVADDKKDLIRNEVKKRCVKALFRTYVPQTNRIANLALRYLISHRILHLKE